MCVCHIVARTRAETNSIMTHDPLCTMHEPQTDATWCHDCRLIAKVRADERKQAGQRALDYSITKLFTGMETADWIDGIVAAARGEEP